MFIIIFILIIILHVIIIWESTKYVLIISNLFLVMFWFEKAGSRSYASQHIHPRRHSSKTLNHQIEMIEVSVNHTNSISISVLISESWKFFAYVRIYPAMSSFIELIIIECIKSCRTDWSEYWLHKFNIYQYFDSGMSKAVLFLLIMLLNGKTRQIYLYLLIIG
jgi:hypothetical protein